MDVLKKICKLKKDEIANLKKKDFSDNKFQIRNFLKKLVTDNKKKYNLIAEIKKSSPSKGLICKNFNLEKIAKAKGFLLVSSSPLTRSSYHADEDFDRLKKNRGNLN